MRLGRDVGELAASAERLTGEGEIYPGPPLTTARSPCSRGIAAHYAYWASRSSIREYRSRLGGLWRRLLTRMKGIQASPPQRGERAARSQGRSYLRPRPETQGTQLSAQSQGRPPTTIVSKSPHRKDAPARGSERPAETRTYYPSSSHPVTSAYGKAGRRGGYWTGHRKRGKLEPRGGSQPLESERVQRRSWVLEVRWRSRGARGHPRLHARGGRSPRVDEWPPAYLSGSLRYSKGGRPYRGLQGNRGLQGCSAPDVGRERLDGARGRGWLGES